MPTWGCDGIEWIVRFNGYLVCLDVAIIGSLVDSSLKRYLVAALVWSGYFLVLFSDHSHTLYHCIYKKNTSLQYRVSGLWHMWRHILIVTHMFHEKNVLYDHWQLLNYSVAKIKIAWRLTLFYFTVALFCCFLLSTFRVSFRSLQYTGGIVLFQRQEYRLICKLAKYITISDLSDITYGQINAYLKCECLSQVVMHKIPTYSNFRLHISNRKRWTHWDIFDIQYSILVWVKLCLSQKQLTL